MLKKPEPQTVVESFFDFHEVMEYLEKKYKFDMTDVAGRHTKKTFNESVEYQNFWHHIIDHCGNVINGCYIYLSMGDPKDEYWVKTTPEWAQKIYGYIRAEFEEYSVDGAIRCWVEW